MKLPQSQCCVVGVPVKDEEDNYYPKNGSGGGWNDPWIGSLPELKEKKRTVGEISWVHMDTDTKMGKGKDVVRKKDLYFPVIVSSHS